MLSATLLKTLEFHVSCQRNCFRARNTLIQSPTACRGLTAGKLAERHWRTPEKIGHG